MSASEDRVKKPAKQSNPAICWDFTLWIPRDVEDIEEMRQHLVKTLNEISNDWVFQLEKGHGEADDEDDLQEDEEEEGTPKVHFQGRFRLKTVKKRLTTLKRLFAESVMRTAHLSVTSSGNVRNNFYVTKEDTRVSGPWFSASYCAPTERVPRQVRHITEDTLRPWQKFVFKSIKGFESRIINVIVDRKGNNGKSSFMTWASCHQRGLISVPPVHDFKDVCQFVTSIVRDRGLDAAQTLFVDFPRARDQTKIHQFMAGIERLKDGQLFDTRYKSTMITIDSPNIWMFTNTVLKLDYVSLDRWRFYTIDKDYNLKRLPIKLLKADSKEAEEVIEEIQGPQQEVAEEFNDEVEFVEWPADRKEAVGGLHNYQHNAEPIYQ